MLSYGGRVLSQTPNNPIPYTTLLNLKIWSLQMTKYIWRQKTLLLQAAERLRYTSKQENTLS